METQLILRAADDEKAVAMLEAAQVLVDKAEKFTKIENDDEAAVLGEYRARVAKHRNDLDARRQDLGKGLREQLAALNAEFMGPIEQLDAKKKIADQMLTSYLTAKRQREEAEAKRVREENARREREAREAEERRLAEIARQQREHEEAVAAAAAANAPPPEPPPPPPPPPAPAVVVVPPPVVTGSMKGSFGSSFGLKEKWTWKIVDIKKVPEAYLVDPEDRVNRAVLTALAKSKKATAKVAGIEFFDEGAMGSRVTS